MLKSPISVLQELAQSKRVQLGEYTLVSSNGADHCKTFTYQIVVNDESYHGSGATKQSAKTNCAKIALDAVSSAQNVSDLQIKAQSLLPCASATKNPMGQINYVGQLNEFQQTNRHAVATYQDELPLGLKFCMKCCFSGFETKGVGSTKKDAKQEAAKQMLELIHEKNIGLNLHPVNVTVTEIFNNNVSDEYIIQKYKELSITVKEKDSELHRPNEQYERMDKNVNIKTWQELVDQLEMLGYDYTDPETLQTRPWVVLMTINKGTMMGIGDTRQQALSKMVQSTARMLKDGYRFTDEWIPRKNDE